MATYSQHIKNNMHMLDRLTALLAPHECVSCGSEGTLLCLRCVGSLPKRNDRCYSCQKPSRLSLVCTACATTTDLTRATAFTDYQGPIKQLIWRLKFDGAQAAADLMADYLCSLINSETKTLIVGVPTASSRARRRGYDQAVLIAGALAKRTRLPLGYCLSRVGQTHQVGAGRQQRFNQLQQAFRVTRPDLVRGAHILLIDDVMTTGATMEAAATALKVAGARRVDAVVFAQA